MSPILINPERRNPCIIYEDAKILVIDKAPGQASARRSNANLISSGPSTSPPGSQASAEEWIESAFPSWAPTGGLVHRLDTATSGLLCFAKDSQTLLQLRTRWTTGEVRKTYRAWVKRESIAKPMPEVITDPIGHSRKSSKRMVVLKPGSEAFHRPLRYVKGAARAAATQIVTCHGQQGNHYDLELLIHTGIRHQIRVHLAAYGLPIVGDPLYGSEARERMALHAWRLEIGTCELTSTQTPSPSLGTECNWPLIESPIPPKWHQLGAPLKGPYGSAQR